MNLFILIGLLARLVQASLVDYFQQFFSTATWTSPLLSFDMSQSTLIGSEMHKILDFVVIYMKMNV